MTHRSSIVLCLFAALVLCSCGEAQAFWPFSRVKAQPDSVREKEWSDKFEEWKTKGRPATAAGATAAATPPGAPAPDAATPPASQPRDMSSLIRQAQERAATADDSPAPDSTAAAGFGTPGDSAAADSIAAAEAAAAEAAAAAEKERADAALQAQIAAAAAAVGFKPSFSATMNSTQDKMTLDSSLDAAFRDPSGVTLTAGMTYGDDYNLNQGTNTRRKGLITSFALPLPDQGLKFELRTGNNKRDVLGARTTTNERSTTVTDNRNAGLTSTLGRQLFPGLSANAGYRVDFRYGNQDIIATGTSSGDRENRTNGQAYGFGMKFDRLSWFQIEGRAGRALDNNTDITSSFITPENPTGEQDSSSRGDSVQATISMPLGPILPLMSANYRLTRTRRSFTDPARTSSGATGGGGNFVLETEQRFARSLQMRSTFKPITPMSLDLSYEVGRDSVGYELRANSFNDTKRQRWSVKGSFAYHSNGALSFSFDHGRTSVNRDEVGNPSPQTRTDKENRFTADITQTWIGTLKTRMYGELRLNQGFYVHAGPQGFADRDDFRSQFGLDVDGRINHKMSAGFKGYVRTFDQAFIDPRRSASSRNETEFVTRLNLTYQITPSFKLTQLYGLSSKVLDEIFNPLRNTLNRNHFLQTNWNYVYNPRLSFNGLFNYILQDNGLFLDDPSTPSEERFFSPTVETVKNEAKVDVNYALLPDGKLTISSSQQVVRDRRTNFSGGEAASATTTTRSNLAFGVASEITLGDLQLNSRATRNQTVAASNTTVFYVIDATLKYIF